MSQIPDLFPVPGSLTTFTEEPPLSHPGDDGAVSKVCAFITRQIKRAEDAGRPWQCFVKAAGMMDILDPTGKLQRITVADGSWLLCVWIGRSIGAPPPDPAQPASKPRPSTENLFPVSADRAPGLKEDEKPGSFDTEREEVSDFIRRQVMRAEDDGRPWEARVTEAGIPVGHGLRNVQACDAWLIYVHIGKPRFSKAYLLPAVAEGKK